MLTYISVQCHIFFMTFFQSFILGIVQGITEFLPISSSGHLVIFEHWFGLEVEALRSFDVIVHVGTLVAILIYFWKDIWKVLTDVFKGKFQMALYLIVGTIPAVVVGFTFKDQLDVYFRDPAKVALAMAGAAVLFVIAEYVRKVHIHRRQKQYGFKSENSLFEPKKRHKSVHHRLGGTGVNKSAPVTKLAPTESQLNWWAVILIGLFQSLALIPGVSRSGSTISAGLFGGMNRESAARFSFLLGSIAIFGAGLLTTKDVISEGLYFPGFTVTAVGFFASLISGYVSVAFLMKFLKKNTLHVFAVYLIIVAIVTWSHI